MITTPLLARFLAAVREEDEDWSRRLATRLEEIAEGVMPEVWDLNLGHLGAPAAYVALQERKRITVGDLLRDNGDRDTPLPVVVLMIERNGRFFLLPEDGFSLISEDSLLVAGQHSARSVLKLTLQNANALDYVLTGNDHRGGWLWQTLFSKKADGA